MPQGPTTVRIGVVTQLGAGARVRPEPVADAVGAGEPALVGVERVVLPLAALASRTVIRYAVSRANVNRGVGVVRVVREGAREGAAIAADRTGPEHPSAAPRTE